MFPTDPAIFALVSVLVLVNTIGRIVKLFLRARDATSITIWLKSGEESIKLDVSKADDAETLIREILRSDAPRRGRRND